MHSWHGTWSWVSQHTQALYVHACSNDINLHRNFSLTLDHYLSVYPHKISNVYLARCDFMCMVSWQHLCWCVCSLSQVLSLQPTALLFYIALAAASTCLFKFLILTSHHIPILSLSLTWCPFSLCPYFNLSPLVILAVFGDQGNPSMWSELCFYILN